MVRYGLDKEFVALICALESALAKLSSCVGKKCLSMDVYFNYSPAQLCCTISGWICKFWKLYCTICSN